MKPSHSIPDIDIDLGDREQLIGLIRHIPASQLLDARIKKHNSGIHVTDIPWDPVHACSAIDYLTAEQRGYFKIDLLNMSVYQLIRDQAHYQQMLDRTPPWERLWTDPSWAQQLVHVGNYTKLLDQMRPDSIERMAAFISIIRPGKAHLQGLPWREVFATVWDSDNSRGYTFKKSHALGYSMLVSLHMNLLDSTDQHD